MLMNIFHLLRRDHHEIDSLLNRLGGPPGAADFDRAGRQYLLDRLVLVASRHEAGEQLVLWPAVRRHLAGGGELVDQALEAEREAKAVLDLLRILKDEQELIDTCAEFRALVRAHARFEEETVFPQLRKHTTRVWASLAGIRFRMARRAGPTRPHPKGPDRPIGLLTWGAPAVLVDHLRDLRSRQRRHPVGFDEPGRADAIAVLTEDHARIGGLLSHIEDQEDPDDKLVQSIIQEVSIHDAIERQLLYPAVRLRLQDGNALYQQLISEHGQIARLAANLDVYRFHDEGRNAWIHELIVDARTHMEQEETTVLPALAARMTAEELVDLGARLETAKLRAPTRPHPHTAGAGAGARLSRWVAMPIDKARDAMVGRRIG